MTHGQYKIRGRSILVMVAFARHTLPIDEIAYRQMGYRPDFDELPWVEDYQPDKAA